MRVKPIDGRVRILHRGRLLADSTRALRVLEAGKDLYDPTIYLPVEDLGTSLQANEKQGFCPINGHADYFDLLAEDSDLAVEEIARSYRDALEMAADLRDRIAFYPSKVTVEEHPVATEAAAE